ncbi:uncharacterized protein E0L32_006130 [Thyridium curvatum]|uniref:FAD-binding domain-containing protein n=1 Tax=Thyridium curvatum TaxID=1093900 RepID=A0A507B9X3_9PEZI|nr:uncharacterized protein E0L32_006130 [Thyridium curvatum]TPX13400.1 hypothetical protein E0L32_006130 [Thyridium curvatum]
MASHGDLRAPAGDGKTASGPLETEFLVVGAGPAGASLACFLASYGLKGIMISAAPGTADTPRAHITNMAAQECLRDIGLDQEVEQVSSQGHCMVHTRWCHSMAGVEYARLFSWGNDPQRKGDYEEASPCSPVDLPQTLLEPILVRHATHSGFKTRFDTSLTSFSRDAASGAITAQVRDNLSGAEYAIRTRYLFGADGAQSQVVKQLGIPLVRKPGGGLAINVLVRADLSHLVDSRRGNLHWVMQPDREHPAFGWMALVRMVKPWHEWMFILFPEQGSAPDMNAPRDEYLKRVKEMIGDDTPAEILGVSKWFINEIVAERYDDDEGNIFCLGDAVHRHPPFNGLGSNTCIQDAFNLAWKVAYVHRGLADPSLLKTYSAERQPVGKAIITQANDSFREHFHVWEALGATPKDLAERTQILSRLEAEGPEGRAGRKAFREAIHSTRHEFHALGIEMGQHYESAAVAQADEPAPYAVPARVAEDPVLHLHRNTYPGCRLPHVWLNTAVPSTPKSTIDLAGHGKFVLFTGIGGGAWKAAAATVAAELGVPVDAHSIGFRQDWEDFYFDWERLRGVEESGAVLVRPDRFVAWRCQEVVGDADACAARLKGVIRGVLGFKE